ESGAEAQITADLSGSLPRYRLAGKVSGIEYKNGHLDIDGTVESRGLDLDVVANAHGEGTFEGEDVAFAPDMEFKTISGAFEWVMPLKLRVKILQAGQGFESYTGQGAGQPDGRLLLELM